MVFPICQNNSVLLALAYVKISVRASSINEETFPKSAVVDSANFIHCLRFRRFGLWVWLFYPMFKERVIMLCIQPEGVERIKRIDLLTYLRECEPDELIRLGGVTYSRGAAGSLGRIPYKNTNGGISVLIG
jgi:hypothetical protein